MTDCKHEAGREYDWVEFGLRMRHCDACHNDVSIGNLPGYVDDTEEPADDHHQVVS